jgi:acetolactate synthase-1/3 small subunit
MTEIMKQAQNHPLQLIAIYADDKKGLLGQIMMPFNRRDYPVYSLNIARTDLQEVVLITLEVHLPEADTHTILMKLEKIIEVYRAEAYKPEEIDNPKIGLFRLKIEALGNPTWILIQKHGATVCGLAEDAFLIRKIGTENDLKSLYNQLEGPYLLDFCQSSVVAPEILLRAEKIGG